MYKKQAVLRFFFVHSIQNSAIKEALPAKRQHECIENIFPSLKNNRMILLKFHKWKSLVLQKVEWDMMVVVKAKSSEFHFYKTVDYCDDECGGSSCGEQFCNPFLNAGNTT